MDIDIYSDVACPWCYLGKRRLETALESFDGDVTVRWHPYQLDPSAPAESRPLEAALADKFGGADQVRQMNGQFAELGREAGLDYRFDRAWHVNTFEAHRLAWFARREGRGDEIIDALFHAYFTDGADLGRTETLVEVGVAAGLDAGRVTAFLASDEGAAELRGELDEARGLGITSVPTFVFAGKYAVAGAQDPDTMLGLLTEVRQRESATPTLTPLGGDATTDTACDDDSCAV